MKVRIHPRHEWRVPGRATGVLRCTIQLPALEIAIDRRFPASKQRFATVAGFVRNQLRKAESALTGGACSIFAEVRASSLGVRWKRIGKWHDGESVGLMLQEAASAWKKLPKEAWHECEDSEMDFEEAVRRLRRRELP